MYLLKVGQSSQYVAKSEDVAKEIVVKVQEPELNTERILHWRKIKHGNKVIIQYLVTYQERPLEDAEWHDEEDFIGTTKLEEPTKDPSSL